MSGVEGAGWRLFRPSERTTSDEEQPREPLRFFPDWGAESPIWSADGVMVWLDSLPLAAELRSALARWCETMEREVGEQRWEAEGRILFDKARVELAEAGIRLVWDND